MKAIIYTRVSTAGQAIDGVSLEAQQQRAYAWAIANGYDVIASHSDAGISGSRASNRPGLQAALQSVCAEGGAALIVYSLSRLARSTQDAICIAERIEKAGGDLISLTEKIDTTSAAGKMIFRLLAVLAEFERDLVSERTKAAMAHKAAKGERVGNIPYGYSLAADGVALLVCDKETALLSELRALKAKGLSWRQVAETLNGRGVTTKKGRNWTWQTARLAATA
jgi:DNA invertase Pin-like site-specific DNA recombinase